MSTDFRGRGLSLNLFCPGRRPFRSRAVELDSRRCHPHRFPLTLVMSWRFANLISSAFEEKPDLQTQHIGELMPGFRLPQLHGSEEKSLDYLLQGRKGALVVLWSGACAHCVRYDGYLNGFAERHPALGFAAIASRINETREQMTAAVRDRGLSFPILRDEGARVARLWFSQQTPRCYLLDQEGRLLYRGAIDNFKLPTDPGYIEYLEPAVGQFLSGEPIARADTPSFGCAIETVYYQLPKQL